MEAQRRRTNPPDQRRQNVPALRLRGSPRDAAARAERCANSTQHNASDRAARGSPHMDTPTRNRCTRRPLRGYGNGTMDAREMLQRVWSGRRPAPRLLSLTSGWQARPASTPGAQPLPSLALRLLFDPHFARSDSVLLRRLSPVAPPRTRPPRAPPPRARPHAPPPA